MENNDQYQLSTWGSLWRYIGIERHATYGYYYMLGYAKATDYIDWSLYYLGLKDQKPPLKGETPEDFYIRKIYSTSYDCFNRPICGSAAKEITVGIRREVPIENMKHLVLVDGVEREALNFGSYNYLGFGGLHPIVTPQILKTLNTTGATMSGFASEGGVSAEQEELEELMADFLHKESAIVVPMGFATNSTLIPILLGKGDVVFSDELNHSSIITGIKSSNAEVKVFKHNDISDLKNKLELLKTKGMKDGSQPKKVMVIAEGLYSMEGQFCPLRELIALKKIYGFYLYIDEAHSIGALGETGRGITEHLGCSFEDVDVLMGTFSKSFASAGGYIAADKKTIELLKSNCYSYIYGSAMSPIEARQIIAALNLMKTDEGKQRIAQLRKNSITFREKLIHAGCHVLGDRDSPVIPVMLYHAGKVKDVSRGCLKRGVAVVGVGYPACSITACRVRFCISAAHTDADMEKAFNATMESLKEVDCIFGNTPQPNVLYTAKKVDIEELENEPKNPRTMTPLYENSDKRPILEKIERPEKTLTDLCTYDIYGFGQDKERTQILENVINHYGCGSCGPRGFYGTTLEHLSIEAELMKFYNVNDALVYSYGNNTLTSVVPVYGQAGDTVLVDEMCNYEIQLGCRLAKKAKIVKFKHNDVQDVIKKIGEIKETLVFPGRIAIVTEGVFRADFSLAPLAELSKLRKKNVLLIVDDSLGVGVLGAHLKGSLEQAGLTVNDVDVYCGNMEMVCDTIGGFVVGKYSMIDKQRLFGAGYIFSASAPPFTCRAATYAFQTFDKEGVDKGIELRERRKVFDQMYEERVKNVKKIGDDKTPYVLLDAPDNENLVKVLRENGFFVAQQVHLIEDWCQTKYVRVNIGQSFTPEKIKTFIEVLAKL
ncbi:serine palmitoyltransferase, putative [Entamoeba invadens IP1]|uniref:serine C-palmitoyltransferase n=1 Tax=Entamoeba invadens IP1 TaxID=370355 RepID=A0A0A1U3Y9_ENTIV|nr:serine palmitoyltransferase, putative [Entamoeba invadens IP1]ELP87408.1 serine palmitoyltransferase, putative [Entamoeba invadens IP1]|eukprot:XP_004254179.1 serine palmitoyltransferase, putative [Entamoeba invadens IP1]